MPDFVTILSNFGFPIALAIYLLFRYEKKIDAMEGQTEKLCQKIDELSKVIEGCKGRRR